MAIKSSNKVIGHGKGSKFEYSHGGKKSVITTSVTGHRSSADSFPNTGSSKRPISTSVKSQA